jgi:hypothetical protein
MSCPEVEAVDVRIRLIQLALDGQFGPLDDEFIFNLTDMLNILLANM